MAIEQLGPYKIGQRIGKGGMGSVYEAVDADTGRAAAVKALSPSLAAAEGFRERFESEIESLKKLQHDGIVRMFGYGEDQGVLFYSMERVAGPSLEDEIGNGRRFTWRETLDIAIQLCRALKHAHDHGVVHRDIKPANILIAEDGRVKLADFGIARLFGATQLTTAGGVLGTADYMSPEQADGRPVTDKCDQYALGCVMYALLAGRPPFRAKTMPEMLQMQRYANPESVRRYAPETPEQLDKLILQLLSKEPDERFPNVLVLSRHMEAMRKALERKEAQAAENAASGAPTAGDGTVTGANPTLSGDPVSLVTVGGDDALFDAPTIAEDGSAAAAASIEAPSTQNAIQPPSSRFTTVDEDARLRQSESETGSWGYWASVAGLLGALLALVYGGYRITRPATADEIYADVTAAVEADRTEGLRAHRDEIDDFLERFPDDPRAGQFVEYQQELELMGLATRLRVRAKWRNEEQSQPAARWYADAVANREEHPEEAIRMLENLLLLYGIDPHGTDDARFDDPALALDKDQRRWLRVVSLELNRLRAARDDDATLQLPQLQMRLQAAARLENSDPSAAKRIYRGMVELYANKPWASDVVRTAKARLEALGE